MSFCLGYILIDELDALFEARFRAQRRTKHFIPNETLAQPDHRASVASFVSASSHGGGQTPVELVKHYMYSEPRREITFPGGSKRLRLDENCPQCFLLKG